MNRFYLIIPIVFLTLFGGVYWYHIQQSDADTQARAAAVAAAESAAKAQQSAAEAKAPVLASMRDADSESLEFDGGTQVTVGSLCRVETVAKPSAARRGPQR